MSAQFTKGPWSIHDEPTYSIYGTPSVYICRGDQPWPEGQLARVNTADEFGSQVANARLIAAAPSLYSDAEFLCARIRELEAELSGDDEVSRQYFGHVQPAVARMESGLAEARGETSE